MTQKTNELTARVLSIVRSELVPCTVELTPQTDLLTECRIDSLDALRLALQVETEFGIEFDQSDLANFRTIADIVRVIEADTARVGH